MPKPKMPKVPPMRVKPKPGQTTPEPGPKKPKSGKKDFGAGYPTGPEEEREQEAAAGDPD